MTLSKKNGTNMANPIDEYDRRILYELVKDCRQTIRQLAVKIAKGKDFVAYRIKRLKKKGILTDYYVVLDTSKLGFEASAIYLQILNPLKMDEVIDYLRERPEIWGINEVMGEYQIYASAYVRNKKEMETMITHICQKFPGIVGGYKRLKYYEGYSTAHNYLFKGYDWISHEQMRYLCKEIELSDKEKQFLYILHKDPRASFHKIAQEMNCRRQYVKRMYEELCRKEVILTIRPSIDASKLKFVHKQIQIKLKFEGLHMINEVKNYLLRQHASKAVILTEGDKDIIGRFIFEDLDALREFLKELYGKFGQYLRHVDYDDYYEELKYAPARALEMYWKGEELSWAEA